MQNRQFAGYSNAARPAVGIAAGSREKFIVRTYNHLFAAIVLFALIEIGLFMSGAADVIMSVIMGTSWLLPLGAFMIVGFIASRVAHRSQKLSSQYLALGAYVLAEAIIFVPLLYIANAYAPGVISSASFVTFAGFAILTGVAFVTKKDFSFLRGILLWGAGLALVAIVAAVLFGFHLGTWFSVAMIGLAGAAILYDTSNVLRHYPEDRYVGAALSLFASVALMFWYVLQLFLASRD